MQTRAARGHSLLDAKRKAIDGRTVQVLEDELRDAVFFSCEVEVC